MNCLNPVFKESSSLFAQLDFSVSSAEAGNLASIVIWFLFLLLCARGYQKPGTNRKCALALGLVCLAPIIATVLRLIEDTNQEMEWLRFMARGIVLVLVVVSVLVAIWGWIEFDRHRDRWVRGKGSAATALVISVFFGAIAVSKLRSDRLASERLEAIPDRAGAERIFSKLNFRFQPAPGPWVALDGQRFNENATLLFTRGKPEVFFMIIAEELGIDFTPEGIAELAKGQMQSVATAQFSVEKPQTIRGLHGITWESRVQVNNLNLRYVHWAGVTNGFVYQLITWGKLADEEAVRREAARMQQGFETIDINRVAQTGNAKILNDFESQTFGYQVALGAENWKTMADLATDLPDADFGAMGANATGLIVIPVALLGANPSLESLKLALLARLDINPLAERFEEIGSVQAGPCEGELFRFERNIEGNNIVYRIKILRSSHFAYLIAAWRAGTDPRIGNQLQPLVDRVTFTVPVPDAPIVEVLTPKQRRSHGLVFNDIGIFYHTAKQFEKSVEFFKEAVRIEKTEPTFLSNLVRGYEEQNLFREALSILNEDIDLFPSNQELRAKQASLQARLGETANALKNYHDLFKSGFRDDDFFVDYLSVLAKDDRMEKAVNETETYLKQADSLTIRLQQAELYKNKGDLTNSIRVLLDLKRRYPSKVEVLYALGDHYQEAGRFAESLDSANELIKRGYDTAWAFYIKGQAEYSLKWYRDSKASFEAALKKDPKSDGIRTFLDHVSGMLGEGSNSGVKKEISAVEVPESILGPSLEPLPASELKDYGAHYLQRHVAVCFEPGKELKTTEFFRAKINDTTGVAAFSAVAIPFDPLTEEVFVNELFVEDTNGSVVATGKVSDYYVLDHGSQETASQEKVLHVPVPGLRPGTTVQLKFTRRDLSPPEKFRFKHHIFSRTIPVLRSVFFVRGDVKQLKYESWPEIAARPIESGVFWTVERPAVSRYEPLQSSRLPFLPSLWVGDRTVSWESEAKRYIDLIAGQIQPDATIGLLAEKQIKGLDSEIEKVEKLARFVQDQISYKAIEFGRRALVPNRAANTIQQHYGDCKDHSVLLQQLLQSVGIEARLALTHSEQSIRKGVPSLDQFNHMLVYLTSEGSSRFLDCTDKHFDFAHSIPYGLAGQEVLVLDKARPRFAAIPDYPLGANQVVAHREVRITDGGDLDVEEILKLHGVYGGSMRKALDRVQPGDRKAMLQSIQGTSMPSLELSDCQISNMNDTKLPLTLTLRYLIKQRLRTSGGQITGQLPAIWERYYGYSQPVDKRQTPFEIRQGMTFRSTITLHPPPGYKLLTPPADFKLEGPAITGWSRMTHEAEKLAVDFVLEQPRGQLAAEKYAAFQQAMDKALRALELNVSFAKEAR